jgi:hypothetical protein
MKLKTFLLTVMFGLFVLESFQQNQTATQTFSSAGIWQDYGKALSGQNPAQFKGRLVNVKWSDIETAPNTWDWTAFDLDINQHIVDGMPVILMVYTGMNAPTWIYSNGVPKVIETASDGSTNTYSPYYLDEDYNVYFKRMVTNVRQHIETLPSSVRNQIIGIQACFGSTGDQIAYKGTVANKYAISTTQLDSLFKVYSLYYYNEYKSVTPKITMLSNPLVTDSTQLYWLLANCPGGWIKCGSFAKGSQLNFELDKNQWLYDAMNKPQSGQYVQSRCETTGGAQLTSGSYTKNQYKEMFGIMCYGIYWGLDWPNQMTGDLQNPKFDSAFAFFNKYAGQKVPATATNAVCALKDALDASDGTRFPASQYGTVDRFNTQRYQNIYNSFSAYGAKLEDTSALTGYEYASLSASGTNDVGWRLLPGNYERFLHQINANATSAGYWNIDDAHNDVMYGRFGRGFDIANNKTALYFDVENNFFRNAPLNAVYPVTIEITYFDNGTGSWKLFYDAKGNKNKLAATVTCTNTGTWIKRTVTLTDAYFGNRSTSGADFYIASAGSENVIFSTVELSRQAQSDAGLIATTMPAFDTVCINTTTSPRSFVINGASLNGNLVKVNALNGYAFSTSSSGPFTSTLSFSNYGSAINATVYVQQVTSTAGDFTGTISITGGGSLKATVKAISVVQNSSPELNAAVSTISCYNQKDGIIDLQPTNGNGPFTYKWTNDAQKFWTDSSQDISGLVPANYTVVVTSARGCSTSKTFSMTQPDKITVSAVQDSAIFCTNGSTTVTVSAMGGTMPYTGTGSFTVKSGNKYFPVTDTNGCKGTVNLIVANGTVGAPPKPDSILGPSTILKLQSNVAYSVQTPNESYTYTWTVPTGVVITDGQNTKSITGDWGSYTGSVTVKANNGCGTSPNTVLKVTAVNKLSGGSTGMMQVNSSNTNMINTEMQLTPNPVASVATVRLSAENNYHCTVQIVDAQGKVLLKKQSALIKGTNYLKLDVSSFKPGAYFISVTGEGNHAKTVKMIKQ